MRKLIVQRRLREPKVLIEDQMIVVKHGDLIIKIAAYYPDELTITKVDENSNRILVIPLTSNQINIK